MMALIYKLYVDEEEKDERCYIGSTTQTMKYRLYAHFHYSNGCTSSILINQYGKNKIKYIILEECKATNRKAREKYWIQNTENTVNDHLPYESINDCKKRACIRTKNYNDLHRDEKLKKDKEYQLLHKDDLKFKVIYKCECGYSYTYKHKSRHIKTKKHQAYLNQLNSFTPVCTVEAASATQIHTDNQALSS